MSQFARLKVKFEVDSLILGLASVTLATVVYFIFSDGSLFEQESKDSFTPVGSFSVSKNDVRRRVDAGLTWTPIASSAPVYEGDSVFTGENSTAGVVLHNGSQLTIDPNSLVVIRTSNKAVEIDLQYGQLVGKVESDKPILIKQQDGEYKALEATSAEVRITQKEKAKDTQIQVVKGEVKIRPEKKRELKEKATGLKSRLTRLFKTEEPAARKTNGETDDETPAAAGSPRKTATREPKVQVVRQNETIKLESKPVVPVADLPAAPPPGAAPPTALGIAPFISLDGAADRESAASASPPPKSIEIRLVSPAPDRKVWLKPESDLKFQWSGGENTDAKTYRLEIARDESFLQSIYSKDVFGDFYSVPEKERPDGTFYWRVLPSEEGKKSGLKPSAPRRLSVYLDTPPQPSETVATSEPIVIDTDNGEPGKQIPLAWEDKSGAAEYKIEIARDENFQDVVFAKTVGNPNVETPTLPTGVYHWRVKGVDADRPSAPWSQASRFEIKEAEKPLFAPVLKNSRVSYDIPVPVLNRLPAAVIASGGGVKPEKIAPFSWEPVFGAASYDVEISKNADFDGDVATENVGTATSFKPDEVRPGPLFMRVRAKSASGRSGPSSPTARLDVILPPPRLSEIPTEVSKFKTEEEMAKGHHEFQLTWTPRPFADAYELEWGADPAFKRSRKIQVKGTSHSISVTKPMDYSARVRALGSDGTPISPYSDTQLASYKKEILPPPAPLVQADPSGAVPGAPGQAGALVGTNGEAVPDSAEAKVIKPVKPAGPLVPQLREPASETSLVSLGDSPVYVHFKWRKVPRAGSYTLQLSSDEDFASVISEHKVTGESFFLKKKLPEGRVYWRVRSNLGAGPAEWSEPFMIKVKYN